MEDKEEVEEILDTIGDPQARQILALLSQKPLSAKEIGEVLEFSLPTVYRRLDLLRDHELVRAETLVGENGNHYKVFQCNFDSTVISLEDAEYSIRVYREDSLPDRFASLWDDLAEE
ncbi:MAG: helix-turn-helix domain-containing protein [Salinigranum sp.]